VVDTIGITILLGSFIILVLLKFPVAFALAFAAFSAAAWDGTSLGTITQRMIASVDNFALLAIPFFILAGEIMGAGGISDRLFNLARVFVGRLKGGIAMVNALDSVFFGMISGSAVAAVSSMGPIEIRMMKRQGYPTPFAVALSCTSATIAVITPPSHNMIIFASAIGGASVGRLFMAGLLPGYLLCLLLLIYCYIMARIKNFPYGGSFTFKESLKIIVSSLAGLATVFIILGGVFAGIVTANESAVLACMWAIIVALFIYRGLKPRDIIPVMRRALKTIAMVMALIAAAGAFGFMMTIFRIPDIVTNSLLGLTENRILLLLLINLALLLMGAIMDMAPMILITAPILHGVVTGPVIGMDSIHFGIMLIYNLSLGLLTPPVGTVLFVGSAIGGIKIEETVKALLPFYLVMLVGLLLITFIPSISLALPNLMFNG